MQVTPEECAREIIEVVPAVMRSIRSDMRAAREPGLTVPQFRALVYLNRHAGGSLSDVAAYIGLGLPAASTLVDGLVARSLVARETDRQDRRRVTLRATDAGRAAYEAAHAASQACLAEQVAGLDDGERSAVVQALAILRRAFATTRQEV